MFSVGRLSVVGADALKIGAVEGAPPGEGRESLEAAIPPMAVLAWDLAPFRDKAECASVRVDDVSVTKKGRTYQGSVRLGEEVALGTLTQVLSDAIDGDVTIDGFGSEPWSGTFSSPGNLYGTASGSGTYSGIAYTYTMELDLNR